MFFSRQTQCQQHLQGHRVTVEGVIGSHGMGASALTSHQLWSECNGLNMVLLTP